MGRTKAISPKKFKIKYGFFVLPDFMIFFSQKFGCVCVQFVYLMHVLYICTCTTNYLPSCETKPPPSTSLISKLMKRQNCLLLYAMSDSRLAYVKSDKNNFYTSYQVLRILPEVLDSRDQQPYFKIEKNLLFIKPPVSFQLRFFRTVCRDEAILGRLIIISI